LGILEELLERVIKIENILSESQKEKKARSSKNGLSADEIINELLENKFNIKMDKYPLLMDKNDVLPLLGLSTSQQLYNILNNSGLPGAKKIPGIGWRINRDVFFAWLYKNEI
jgi:hypothetical protein